MVFRDYVITHMKYLNVNIPILIGQQKRVSQWLSFGRVLKIWKNIRTLMILFRKHYIMHEQASYCVADVHAIGQLVEAAMASQLILLLGNAEAASGTAIILLNQPLQASSRDPGQLLLFWICSCMANQSLLFMLSLLSTDHVLNTASSPLQGQHVTLHVLYNTVNMCK